MGRNCAPCMQCRMLGSLACSRSAIASEFYARTRLTLGFKGPLRRVLTTRTYGQYVALLPKITVINPAKFDTLDLCISFQRLRTTRPFTARVLIICAVLRWGEGGGCRRGLAAAMKETLAGLLQLAALEGFLCRGDARASRHQYS